MADDLKAKEGACPGNIYVSKRDLFALAG